MTPKDILAEYASGTRQPVLGPFTHVESIGLVSLHDKLLGAVQGLIRPQIGTGIEQLQAKLAAHHKAHQVVRLATNGGPVLDAVQSTGFHSVTPICANCQHCKGGAERSCSLYAWPVQMSSTCNSHQYHPVAAKHIPIRCAA